MFNKIVICLFIFCFTLIAEETREPQNQYGWKKEGVGVLNFTQNQFENWPQGGENSISWQLDINTKFNLDKSQYIWSNLAKISYGKTKIADQESRKSSDEVKFESVLKYKITKYLNPYISATLLTQMTEGYEYHENTPVHVSGFMDPGYLTQSIGFGYEPSQKIKTRLGAAIKETITQDFADTYANGEKTRIEYGAESVTDLNLKLDDNILFTSKLELFSNLKSIKEIDVSWDNLFSSKISKYITVTLNIKILYDQDISIKRQFKQTLALGISYNFL